MLVLEYDVLVLQALVVTLAADVRASDALVVEMLLVVVV